MSVTDSMRRAFDDCTVMACADPDFECVYIAKNAALLYLNEIDAENAKLKDYARECLAAIIGWTWAINEHKGVDLMDDSSPATQTMKELLKRAKELGVET